MIVFLVQRSLFFFSYFDRLKAYGFEENCQIFIKGLRLDASMSGYFLLITFVFALIHLFLSKYTRFFDKIIHVYTLILLVVVLILGLIDIGIYQEWGTKLNSRAIEFLILSPGEALASSSSSPMLLNSLLFVLELTVLWYLYKRYFRYHFERLFYIVPRFIGIILMLGICVVMIRGGLQLAPINQSAVYFSQHTIVNHASLNTEWNLMHSVIENHFSNENPYRFLDETLAKQKVDSLYKCEEDSNISILKNTKPNIVFIVLESYTSDVVEHFGGEQGVAPNLSRLAREGISFKNIYASGDRTDKGLIAILSAFPSQAVRTIIQQPDKFEKLPSITKLLSDKGYNTSFYYGGESEFANFKSYLITAGVQEIIDKNNFDKSQMNSKWGAHDGFLFEKVLQEFKNKKSPFASVVLSLSSHEPFEIPVESPYNGSDLPSQFRKAAHYTDQCLKSFFDNAKKEAWYKNTLFVLVADHGHRLPKEYNTAYEIKKFRIPLILYGDVIKEEYRGFEIMSIGSQTDIATTLLTQLNINSTQFVWSKNLLNKRCNNFAFYSYDNGIGWVDEHNAYTMDNVTQQNTSRTNFDSLVDENMLNGKAYMQMVFSTYLAY